MFTVYLENVDIENNITSLQHLQLYRGGPTHDWDEEEEQEQRQGLEQAQGQGQGQGQGQALEQGQGQGLDQQPPSSRQGSGMGREGDDLCSTVGPRQDANQGPGLVQRSAQGPGLGQAQGLGLGPGLGQGPGQGQGEGEREMNSIHSRLSLMNEDSHHGARRMTTSSTHGPPGGTLIPRQITGQTTFDTILPGSNTSEKEGDNEGDHGGESGRGNSGENGGQNENNSSQPLPSSLPDVPPLQLAVPPPQLLVPPSRQDVPPLPLNAPPPHLDVPPVLRDAIGIALLPSTSHTGTPRSHLLTPHSAGGGAGDTGGGGGLPFPSPFPLLPLDNLPISLTPPQVSARGSDPSSVISPTNSCIVTPRFCLSPGLGSGEGPTLRKRKNVMMMTSTGAPALRILLTDDTQTILKVAGRLLRTNGHAGRQGLSLKYSMRFITLNHSIHPNTSTSIFS